MEAFGFIKLQILVYGGLAILRDIQRVIPALNLPTLELRPMLVDSVATLADRELKGSHHE